MHACGGNDDAFDGRPPGNVPRRADIGHTVDMQRDGSRGASDAAQYVIRGVGNDDVAVWQLRQPVRLGELWLVAVAVTALAGTDTPADGLSVDLQFDDLVMPGVGDKQVVVDEDRLGREAQRGRLGLGRQVRTVAAA